MRIRNEVKLTIFSPSALAMPFCLLALVVLSGYSMRSSALESSLSGAAAGADDISLDGSLQPFKLMFEAEFAGKPFSCNGQYPSTGQTEATVAVSDYKLFISNVRAIDRTGAEHPIALDDDGLWQNGTVGLLDFEDGTGNCSNGTAQTNQVISGAVVEGDYVGVIFDIGVPFESNHADPTLAGPPMNLTSMFWNWRGGYRFMRIDLQNTVHTGAMSKKSMQMSNDATAGMTQKAANTGGKSHGATHGGGRGWSLHIGSTGCDAISPTSVPSSCLSSNRISVEFDRFDAGSDVLVIDPANVLNQVDVTQNTPETAPGCMSSPKDPECSTVMKQLGLSGSPESQQLVSVRQ